MLIKHLRITALSALFACLPIAGYSQSVADAQTDSQPVAQMPVQTTVQCPKFEKSLAASLWQRWIRHEAFSQEDYSQALDMCMAAYEYLNNEMGRIIEVYPAGPKRRKAALNALDTGVASDMTTFARTMTNRLQDEAAAGKFNTDNIVKINRVLKSKAKYRNLQNEINH